MRHAVRLLLAGALLLGPAAGLASAVSIRDLVKLKTAGLSDQVLIELIHSDGSVFHLTADDVLSLRQQGLSDQVIVAMLRTAAAARTGNQGTPDAVSATPATTSGVSNQAPQVRQVHVEAPAPAVVNVTQTVEQRVESPRRVVTTVEVPVPVAVPVAVPVIRRPDVRRPAPQSVYWGWGGQRRPDSWGPATPATPKPPAKPACAKPAGGCGL